MSRLRPFGPLCPNCRSVVPPAAHTCPTCKSPLGWRGYINASQTTLALLVALVTVTTSLLNVLLPLAKPSGSDIQILFESMSATEGTFLVRNNGRSGGVLRIDTLQIGENVQLELEDNSTLVEPGVEQRISVMVRKKDGEKPVCDTLLAGLTSMDELRDEFPHFHGQAWENVQTEGFPSLCVFNVRETSFNSKDRGERTFSVECKNISFMSECLQKRLNS
jgi:hypothetical protein